METTSVLRPILNKVYSPPFPSSFHLGNFFFEMGKGKHKASE